MSNTLMNSVSSIALLLAVPRSKFKLKRRFPKRTVFIRKLPQYDEFMLGQIQTVYQALDEYGTVVQTYGGDADFAFQTAQKDRYKPQWAH